VLYEVYWCIFRCRLREITLKFIKVDQELKDLKEQINLKKPVSSEVDQIQETEDVVETNIKDASFKGEETVLNKSMDSEIPDLIQDKFKTKANDISKSEGKDSLMKCNKCEYKCKKSETLKKHMNTKNKDYICTICHFRFVLATDLQKHVIEDHSVKNNSEYEKSKTVEPGPGLFDARCSKCGYILFTEESTEECEKPKQVSDKRIVIFPANRNRNRFAEPTSVRIGIRIVREFQNMGIGIIFVRWEVFANNSRQPHIYFFLKKLSDFFFASFFFI
jgi:hypothetical protein